ncbi:hypothetical protein G9A89_007174 [Geosiphon pyriformis]|nr:hypothetical protein G9A89_007174 [Geosiphon pyriformis]
MSDSDALELYPGRATLVAYLKGHDPSLWSYFDFLSANHTTIVNSTPFSNRWDDIDSAWTRRFLKAVQELYPLSFDVIKSKMHLEHANPRLRLFFDRVIADRKRNLIKNTIKDKIDFTVINLYGTSTNETGEELQSLYPSRHRRDYEYNILPSQEKDGEEKDVEDSDQGDSIEGEGGYEEQEMGVSNDSQEQVGVSDIAIDNLDSDLDLEGVGKRREEKKIKENDNTDVEEILHQFSITYKSLEAEKKWTLKSGRKVEDIIYKYGSKLKDEDLVHSFVINVDDQKIRHLFSKDEWKEIMIINTESKGAPKIEENLLKFLLRYRKTTFRELRKVIRESSSLENCNFDTDKWFDYVWMNNCVSNLSTLYAVKPNVFQTSHLERWYDVNIWSSIIDQCMWNISELQLVRGESFSIASTDRKSKNRSLGDRKPFGRRCDGIFRMEKSRQECGASEHGRLFLGENGTKFLTDGHKLAKVMKDMFTSLSMDLCVKTMKDIEIIAYLHSERMMQIFVADYPGGYLVRLCKGNVLQVPETLDKIDDLLKLMATVLSSKLRIIRTVRLLRSVSQPEEKSNEEFMGELLLDIAQIDRSNSSKTERYIQMPDTAKTPSKKRRTIPSSHVSTSPPPKFSIK